MSVLRILTANLWGPNVDPTALADVLAEIDPDVVAAQELDRPAADVIAAHFEHHALDPIGEAMGSGIGLRHPAAVTRIPLRYRSAWSARLDGDSWPQPPVEVIAVHMANPLAWPWWHSLAHRRFQLAGLFAHCDASPGRRVVVGDFNASPAWPLYQQLTARFTDGARAAGTVRRTWRPEGRTPPLLRIDHAFGEGVDFVSTRTVRIAGADHMALVVYVEA